MNGQLSGRGGMAVEALEKGARFGDFSQGLVSEADEIIDPSPRYGTQCWSQEIYPQPPKMEMCYSWPQTPCRVH